MKLAIRDSDHVIIAVPLEPCRKSGRRLFDTDDDGNERLCLSMDADNWELESYSGNNAEIGDTYIDGVLTKAPQ